MSHQTITETHLTRSLGTWQVFVAGVALVVASSTLVSEFTGYFSLGGLFAVALGIGFIVNLALAISAADLSVAFPRAGGLYDYARSIVRGKRGEFLAVFLGLAFVGMFGFAASGETASGAYALQAITGTEVPIEGFILFCGLTALIPNLFGIRSAAWASAGLLLLMLSIRWFFGLAGFFGWGETGAWEAANLTPAEDTGVQWLGDGGLITSGFALAFWSFVGIEFACSLGEEVKDPRKAMPRGLLWGLFAILATSLIMGLGVTGTAPLSVWQDVANGPLGINGEAPQLAVGHLMFGKTGHLLMAVASVTATIGTLTVAYAAMPRIIYAMARNRHFLGPKASKRFGILHPTTGVPVAATLLIFVVYQLPALYSSHVVDWVYTAAYAWIILYGVFHLLALINRLKKPLSRGAFRARLLVPTATAGFLLTLVGLYFAFLGEHAYFGPRVLIVFTVALAGAAISFKSTPIGQRPLNRHLAPEIS